MSCQLRPKLQLPARSHLQHSSSTKGVPDCPSGYRYGSGGYHCQLRSCAVQNSSDDEDDGDILGENKGAMVPEMVIGNA